MRKVRREDISRPVEAALWGRAAGRCQFEGCNRPLWKSAVTQEPVNVAEKAHIYAFSAGGPRGNEGVDPKYLNDFDNLLLVCHDCHRTIDKTIKDGGRYSAELLRSWKRDHENRIEVAGGIAPDKRSHVLLYGANIGEHKSPLTYSSAAEALFPERYPATTTPIELGFRNSAAEDREQDYWHLEAQNLTTLFEKRVRQPLADGLIDHLSVFALAPQPLLILLGSLLIDIVPADVYQRRREPATWGWAEQDRPLDFVVSEPKQMDGPPALVFSLSATIALDRVRSVDRNFAIWEVSIPQPYNDFLHSREQLLAFRQTMRRLLNRIKALHGQDAVLSLFPAMPVACAVELGRLRMPKADLPWRIYDQIGGVGFVPALRVPSESERAEPEGRAFSRRG